MQNGIFIDLDYSEPLIVQEKLNFMLQANKTKMINHNKTLSMILKNTSNKQTNYFLIYIAK
jgi:hypothetical protein